MKLLKKIKQHQFLLEEMVKRDFNKKYRRTVLGVAWSILSPLMMLFTMRFIFINLLGRDTPHYTIFLFSGLIVFNYFNSATKSGMKSIAGSAGIFTKVTVPKYLFLISTNIQSTINFAMSLAVYFFLVALDGLSFTWKFILLLYPICGITLVNVGMGLILSTLYIFFRDIEFVYSQMIRILRYCSAIFYSVDRFPVDVQLIFLLNPVYLCINYFRTVVIDGQIPSLTIHLLILVYASVTMGIGGWMYKKFNRRFLYHV